MQTAQPAICAPLPLHARVLLFDLQFSNRQTANLTTALRHLQDLINGKDRAAGLGWPVLSALNARLDGLQPFPQPLSPAFIPATPYALWIWIRGDEAGEIFHQSRQCINRLAPTFRLRAVRELALYAEGRDLTGYRDGTENPSGDAISDTAFLHEGSPGMRGSSFLALQTWQHDWNALDQLNEASRNLIIGRTQRDDHEIAEAPATAHIRRTAQEDFQPEAFLWRRSMPWIHVMDAGLLFQAFAASVTAFAAQIHRMSGQ